MNFLYVNFIVALWITAITTILLGIFVLVKNRQNVVNKIFAFYSFSISWWSFSEIWGIACDNKTTALIWTRIEQVGVFYIPTLFVHFVFVLVKIKDKKWLQKSTYFISTVFAILCATPLMIADSAPVVSAPYVKGFGTPGLAYHFAITYFITMVVYGLYILYKEYRFSTGEEKNRLKYLFWSSIFGYLGGSANFLLVYGISIRFLNPFGTYALPIYIAVVAYAIVRHQLMDIEVVIKKTLVFATLFIAAFGIFVGITVLTQELIAGGRLLGLAISSLIIIFSVRPLEDFLIRITDKYLFQKKYDYRHIVNKFMDDLRLMALNTKDIAQSTVEFFKNSMRLTKSAVLIYNKFKRKYEHVASFNFENKDIILATDGSIIRRLTESAKIIKVDDAINISEKDKGYFNDLGINIVIPLSIHKELIGIIFLGQKKSDEEYTDEDIEVLNGLGGTLSIALNNAQLFGERADAEKRALVGTLATGINHEIGNPLNVMRIKFDSFRILEKEGFYKNKSKEEVIEEVKNIANACTDSIERIGGIAHQIAEFAKPDKSLVFDKINVKETLDKIITVLKHGMIDGADKIETHMDNKRLYAIVDRGQFEQIIFNLLKNACNAIDKRSGKIRVEANLLGTDGVRIKIIDNGYGMPDDVKNKIFMPFFTTKEPGKGTGLGLTLTKIMAEKNDGEIAVESEKGKGTTFIIVLRGGI